MNSGYPVSLQLTGKNITIIGGGKIANRKAQGLLNTGANITIVAPTCTPELAQMPITRIQSEYKPEHIQDAFLIFCCTDNQETNEQITKDAAPHQLINDCSTKERSNFYNMATIQKPDYLLAISTNGNDPTKTKAIREKIEQSTEF
ncbi:precorrin-2 dehydrogenase/sirohydrochlorin ferrochelatase family protein [Listeria booriae]|uniref:precorrin-2 dehydrogenase/sirohydrochlorin ferrochelatase family protein n=1 Tax=Listeria booriae TaxID=1552123 RepID=UPI00163D5C2D|nr:bifunctional precorrin-2 dehydrogenase/sirohydrochlorin ferrochelatase [Listeria booriae]MBC1307779.1 bifunctional precorrin-2 dehydrogenase/sirohydrochlorin ferrochelatase [Listeria booriae]